MRGTVSLEMDQFSKCSFGPRVRKWAIRLARVDLRGCEYVGVGGARTQSGLAKSNCGGQEAATLALLQAFGAWPVVMVEVRCTIPGEQASSVPSRSFFFFSLSSFSPPFSFAFPSVFRVTFFIFPPIFLLLPRCLPPFLSLLLGKGGGVSVSP